MKKHTKSAIIIAIGGCKGGCGKTTFAINLATALTVKNHAVGILDADHQPSSYQWWKWRQENNEVSEERKMECKRVVGDIGDTITGMASRLDYLIIDCGGYDSNEMRHACMKADIFIAPFKPSGLDLVTVAKVREILEAALIFNSNMRFYTLLSEVSNHYANKLTRKGFKTLQERMGISTVIQTPVYLLDVFRTTYMDGIGVVEEDNHKAKNTMRKILLEVGQ